MNKASVAFGYDWCHSDGNNNPRWVVHPKCREAWRAKRSPRPVWVNVYWSAEPLQGKRCDHCGLLFVWKP